MEQESPDHRPFGPTASKMNALDLRCLLSSPKLTLSLTEHKTFALEVNLKDVSGRMLGERRVGAAADFNVS